MPDPIVRISTILAEYLKSRLFIKENIPKVICWLYPVVPIIRWLSKSFPWTKINSNTSPAVMTSFLVLGKRLLFFERSFHLPSENSHIILVELRWLNQVQIISKQFNLDISTSSFRWSAFTLKITPSQSSDTSTNRIPHSSSSVLAWNKNLKLSQFLSRCTQNHKFCTFRRIRIGHLLLSYP